MRAKCRRFRGGIFILCWTAKDESEILFHLVSSKWHSIESKEWEKKKAALFLEQIFNEMQAIIQGEK